MEAGAALYLPPKNIQAVASNMDAYLGTDIEFRTGQTLGFRLGIIGGRRGYSEEYQRAGTSYELDHKVSELGWRFYLAQTISTGGHGYWELGYGLSGFPRIRSKVAVSTSLGEYGAFNTTEAASFGIRIGAMHSRPSWLHGALQLGVVFNLQLAASQPYLEVPWVQHDNLWVGGSRLFMGVAMSIRVARMPWHHGSEG